METLIKQLKARKAQLDQSAFCSFLKSDQYSAAERMTFAPSMFYFVMGFRDSLHSLKDLDDTSDDQQIVNVHCEEDSTHWMWYLNDINTLTNYSLINSGDAMSPVQVWSEDYWPIRNVVYEVVHRCKSTTDPFMRLLIIQVLEATFGSFNTAIHQPVKELGLYGKLLYFGKEHIDAEEDHSFEDWLEVDEHTYGKDRVITTEQLEEGIEVIDVLFDAFEEMFLSWRNISISQTTSESQEVAA